MAGFYVANDGASDELAERRSAGAAFPPSRQAWMTCIFLTVGCILAFADRGILSLFIIPMQRDLQLTDTEVSLLVGLAFAFFNAVCGLPAARLIDGGNRRKIAAAGVLIWSIAASACGFASNFWQMFLARIGVGAGEAALTPAGVSIIADTFPPERRGPPLGLFYGGMYLGAGGVLIVGGLLWHMIGDRIVTLPLIGAVHSWQAILIGLGSIGFLVAPMTLLIREPERKERMAEGGGAPPMASVVGFYKRHARALLGHNAGFCLQNFTLHAGNAWIPVILVRVHNWSLVEAGLTYGLIITILGPAGSLIAGGLSDALMKRGYANARFQVAIVAAAIGMIGALPVAFAESTPLIVAGLVLFAFFGAFSVPLAPAALQELMPNEMRGQSVAIYVFWTNVIAGGLAPTAVALLTDFFFRDTAMTGQSFGIVTICASTGACLLLLSTLRPWRRALEATRMSVAAA